MMMVSALVETLTKHMFGKALDNTDEVEIGGAPSWYMDKIDDQMCVFTHSTGGFDSIEIAKSKSKIKMTKDINNLVKIVVYENTKNIKSPKEKALLNKWKDDERLEIFVLKNLKYNRVSYEDEVKTAFVRSCIPNKLVIQYQKERLGKIKKSLLTFKTNNALDELDQELMMYKKEK